MKNKKGLAIHWYVLIFAFLLGLGNFFYQYAITESPTSGAYIGEYQLNVIKNFQKGEKALFYIDQSSKYALQQSIYELAQNGGFVDGFEVNEFNANQVFIENKCGKFGDTSIWLEIKKDKDNNIIKNKCFDESILETNLLFFFNNHFNQYIANSPYNILTDNYNYRVKDNLEIVGLAVKPLKFDIIKDETKKIAKEPAKTQEGLVDFTGTEFCANGAICQLTQEAYDLLLKAKEEASKQDKKIVVNSAYRSQEEQLALWNKFSSIPEKAREKRVCNPNKETCPHTTGKAVDILIKDKTLKTMNNDDWLSLSQIMAKAGWVRYGEEKNVLSGEPWHYECCSTIRYSKAKDGGLTAII